jgi:hypothetical protein
LTTCTQMIALPLEVSVIAGTSFPGCIKARNGIVSTLWAIRPKADRSDKTAQDVTLLFMETSQN